MDNKKPLPTLTHRLPTLRWNTVRRQSSALTRFACPINSEKLKGRRFAAKRRKISTHRDRPHYNSGAQHHTLRTGHVQPE
jgi:hypothetical protein